MIAIGNNIPTIALRSAGSDPYKSFWYSAAEGAKSAGATIENLSGSCLMFRGSIIYNSVPPKPSLLIVPQFYKEGNLYQDVPPFVAEDTTMRFTVTRATTATRVNSSGLIESVASGVPRIDWLGQTCPALLVEPSGQNLVLQSENFGTTWTTQNLLAFGSGSVLNTTATLDPYGTNFADFIVANTTLGQHRVDQSITYASGSYVFSAFIKAGGYNFAKLRIGLAGAVFDLSSGIVSAIDSGITSSIQSFGNGWYRCIIVKSASSANETVRINMYTDVAGVDFSGNGTSGIYVFGAQLETGAVATTYIPTTTGAFTRNADQISASGSLVSGLIGQSEGTIYAEVVAQPYNNSLFPAILQVEDGADSQRFALFVNASGGVRLRLNSTNNNISLDATSPTSLIAGQVYKIAAAFAFDGTSALYINGVFQASGSVASGPFSSALNRVNVGSRGGAFISPSRIRAAALYTTRLSNDQLAELTKL